MKVSWNLRRRVVQVGMILIFMLPFLGSLEVIGTLSTSRIFGLVLTDPFAFLEVLVASKTTTASFLISSLLVLGAYMLLGKAFCGWVCPVGFLIEGIDALKRRWKWLNLKQDRKCSVNGHTQYYWALPLFLVLSFIIGIPVFQTFSPVGIVYRSLLFGLGLEVLILCLIVILEMAGFERGWCRMVCPIGMFYALTSGWSPLKVHCNKEKCVHCLKCVKQCNYTPDALKDMVLGPKEFGAFRLCTRCGRCIDVCPTQALEFTVHLDRPQLVDVTTLNGPVEVAASAPKGTISRRKVIKGAGVIVLAGVMVKPSQVLARATPKVFRPPGAVEEDEFLAKCLRCGKCIEVCPDGTLLNAHLDQGLNLGTPYFIPRQIPCSLCMKCPEVCPSGALKPLELRDVKIGIAEVDKDRCYAYQEDVCRSCYNSCPLIDEAIKMKDFQYPVVHPEICTGCGICEYVCVTDPPAIQIRRIT